MKVQSVNQNYQNKTTNQNFGHTFRVNICLVKPDGSYEFVSPAKNTKLYKELNSKFVGWLNENFYEKIRKATNTPRKRTPKKSDNDRWFKSHMNRVLHNLDSDYRELGIVRSIYNRFGLGYVATGIDVPIIERLNGATQIGIAKGELLRTEGITHNEYIEEIVDNFKRKAKYYVKDPINLLRSRNGKELMLDLNFRLAGQNKNGKNIYELDNYKFHEIKKSETIEPKIADLQRKKLHVLEEIRKTVLHQIKQVTKKEDTDIDIDSLLAHDTPPVKRFSSRRKKAKDDSRQLKFDFKD